MFPTTRSAPLASSLRLASLREAITPIPIRGQPPGRIFSLSMAMWNGETWECSEPAPRDLVTTTMTGFIGEENRRPIFSAQKRGQRIPLARRGSHPRVACNLYENLSHQLVEIG